MSVKRYLLEFDEIDGIVRIYKVRKGFYPESSSARFFKGVNEACMNYINSIYVEFLKHAKIINR